MSSNALFSTDCLSKVSTTCLVNSVDWRLFRKAYTLVYTRSHHWQCRGHIKSKDITVDRSVSRHRSGDGYRKLQCTVVSIIHKWKTFWTTWTLVMATRQTHAQTEFFDNKRRQLINNGKSSMLYTCIVIWAPGRGVIHTLQPHLVHNSTHATAHIKGP